MSRVRFARWLATLLLAWSALAGAAPRAWLDRDTIRLGETATLNVETDARGGTEPDFSVLDQHFRRLGTSSSTQLAYVNGKQSARTLWAVALEPFAEGSFGIPSFEVGNERTAPLRLTVLPMPQGGSAKAGDDIFLEVEADPASPYVQQQVRYTIRLYFAVPLLEGQLDEPRADGARISRIGQDVQYATTLQERRYHVVERRYAVVPEASGPLVLPGPRFRGRTPRSGGYGSLLSPSSNLSARADQLTLEVRPRPAAGPMPWLPALSLELQDESGALPAELQVGEPLTLTVRLRAQGLSAEQLPELSLPAIDGAQVYPDQEASQTRDDGHWLQAERVRKFAIVPMRAGALEVPALTIGWWDVGKDAAAVASLPARRFAVRELPGMPAPSSQDDAGPAATDASAAVATGAGAAAGRRWAWFAAAFALLWIVTLVLLLRQRAAAGPAPAGIAPAPAPAPVARHVDWPRVLRGGDPAAIAQAVVIATDAHAGPCRNLAEAASQLDDEEQRTLLARLERVLYRGAQDGTLIAELQRGFARGPRWRRAPSLRDAGRDDATLPPLYPHRE